MNEKFTVKKGDLIFTSDNKLAIDKAKEIGCYDALMGKKGFPIVMFMKTVGTTLYQIILFQGNKDKNENGWLLSTLHNYKENEEQGIFLISIASAIQSGDYDFMNDIKDYMHN